MNNDFLAYVQKLELMTFFLGYPMIYTITLFFLGERKLVNRIFSLLPLSYALTGTIFLGFQLRKLYPDYYVEHIKLHNSAALFNNMGAAFYLFLDPCSCKKSSFKFNS